MDGLAKDKTGDKTMVVVKRKEKEVKLKVLFSLLVISYWLFCFRIGL